MTERRWTRAVAVGDVEQDDLVGVDLEGHAIAVYNLRRRYYATANLCTHEYACLSDGFVIDDIIECPRHQGQFHIPTGEAKGAPVHVALKTYPVKVEDGIVFVALDD